MLSRWNAANPDKLSGLQCSVLFAPWKNVRGGAESARRTGVKVEDVERRCHTTTR